MSKKNGASRTATIHRLDGEELQRIAEQARAALTRFQRHNQWAAADDSLGTFAFFEEVFLPLWELADALAPLGLLEPFGSPQNPLPANDVIPVFPPAWNVAAAKLGAATIQVWSEVCGSRLELSQGKVVRPKECSCPGPIRAIALLEQAVAAIPGSSSTNPNDTRDQFCYERGMAGDSWKEISAAVKRHGDWDSLEPPNGIKQAAARHATKNNLPPIPPRRAGRPAR